MKMEKNLKLFFLLIGAGITIGVFITLILIFFIRANPKSFTIAGVELDFPSGDNSTIQDQPQNTPDISSGVSTDTGLIDEENLPVITIIEEEDSPIISPTKTIDMSTQPLICRSGEFAPQDLNQLFRFEYSLSDNEFIFGQCTEFSGYDMFKQGGVAYIIQGPGVFTWSTKHGWWDICSGGTENDIIEKLDWQANSLETHSNTATGVARRVICSYQDERVICEEK
jgi:hypothetical protein